MTSQTKKSLLERYGIPINHLDFKYIEECKDAREIEKIVHILRSNEEGYYPDLTECAEKKLRELKPNSRLFRIEEQIKGREALAATDLKPIYDWNHDIKTTDKKLTKLVQEHESVEQVPPIRKMGCILPVNNKENNNSSNNKRQELKASERIRSTDYDKWDKYDAEEEILRMDLSEERQQEEVERKNRLNAEKIKKQPLKITEILEETDTKMEDKKLLNLSDIEKEKLSEEFRLRGNDYFRAKEYNLAVAEYTRAIHACPKKAVAAYNNRALTYIKLQRFLDSIKDSEECLKLEPNNVKARLRLAEANYAYGRRRESYQLYVNVLELEAENSFALKAISELRKQFEDLPPPNATRLIIRDESSKPNVSKQGNDKKPVEKPKPKSINYDLADLIKPNRLVKNKFIKTAEAFGKNLQTTNKNKKMENKAHTTLKNDEFKRQNSEIIDLNLPGTKQMSKPKKPLIEEI